MIVFRNPGFFALLIPFALLVALYAWSRFKRQRELAMLGDLRLLQALLPLDALWRRRRKDKLALIGLFFVIAAACGPQWGSKLKEVKHRGVDVFIAMDTSRSMLAEDVEPNRLDRAKRSLGLLIRKLGGNRVGIIAFAKRAVIQCPLTVDNEAASMFLEILDENAVPEQGTSIGDAIRLALQSFGKEDKSGRAIVLLTDGEDHRSDPAGAAQEAKEKGVVIFTIGIGTPKGEVIKNRDTQGNVTEFHKYKGEIVSSQLDEGLLTKIATLTGGRYYRASSTDNEIDEIAGLLNDFDKKEFSTRTYERRHDRFQIFALLALLLLLIEFFFAENPGQWDRVRTEIQRWAEWIKKRRKLSTAALILILFPNLALADMKSHILKGNRLIKKGDYAGARAEFESAQIDSPETAFIPYNIGTTYYLEGKFDEAKKSYDRAAALAQDPALKSMIAYNTGHLLFSTGDSAGAISKFKESLKINPKDLDAKYNIEYIKAGKKPPQPPKGSQDPNKGGGQNQNQQQQGQKGDKDGQQGDGQEQQQPAPAEPKKPGDLSKEDAERVLEMMQDEESEKMKNVPRVRPGRSNKDQQGEGGGEDW